jgi:hypothetical protein
MPSLKPTFIPTQRYQTIQGAHSTGRPLTPWQHALLRCCDEPITVAALARVTHAPETELWEELTFLCEHALVKPVAPVRQPRPIPVAPRQDTPAPLARPSWLLRLLALFWP